MDLWLIAAAAFLAGAIASIAGFGIGSLLTPLVSVTMGTRLAVALISIPHLAATFVRFWSLRRDVNRAVLLHFGLLSAAGGLAGALLHSMASSPKLTLVLAGLLLFAGLGSLTGFTRRMRFGRRTAWAAGALSGLLGGLVGNQGGIRSAALLGFGLKPEQFVATATAIGLMVDAARMPVYFAASGHEIWAQPGILASSKAGVLAGTLFGNRLLRRLPAQVFHRLVGALVFTLGVYMLWKGFS